MTNKIKILVGDDSMEFGVAFANSLRLMDFYVIARPKDGKAILDAVRSEQPDVVICDAIMPGFDAIELLKRLNSDGGKMPKVIVTNTYDSPFVEKSVMDNGASYYLLKPFEPSLVGERIKELMGLSTSGKGAAPINIKSRNDLELVVTDYMHRIGVPAHIKGYHYLREAIVQAINDEQMLESVTKMLYPSVAKRFSTTPSRVERAIRHAIETAWDRGDVQTINELFGCTIALEKGKPTNSEFVAMITDKIKLAHPELMPIKEAVNS